MVKIAPSLLSADISRLAEEVRRVEQCGADWIHVDVMDGHFVPNITFGPLVVDSLRSVTNLFLDVHLMIREPEKHIDAFIKSGAGLITVHVETCTHLHRVLSYIKERGVKAGVALNPATPEEALKYIWDLPDLILVMSVNPGFGGQKFIPAVVPKIEEIARRIAKTGREIELQVDGGINIATAPLVAKAGATVIVAGSAIFGRESEPGALQAIKMLVSPRRQV